MINDNTPKVYLSRRNLAALLSKLDRQKDGEETHCTIVKHQQPSAAYRQTMKTLVVVAVEDEEFYGSQERAAGEMHPAEEDKLDKPSTGVVYSGPAF